MIPVGQSTDKAPDERSSGVSERSNVPSDIAFAETIDIAQNRTLEALSVSVSSNILKKVVPRCAK
jgi:hypothetical protein